MSAPPSIPPRPARAEKSPAPAPQSHMDVPKIPPRPKRGIERSVSPGGDRYAPSPLNDPTYLHNGPPPREGGRLTADTPSRPPSVSMPSLGEEGNEYASFEDLSKTLTNESLGPAGSPQQLKSVAGDLPLHAPTASVPSSTAKSRIQAVTRTDSSSAEAAGFGKQLSVDERVAQSTTKSGRSGSSIGSRPSSIYNDKDAHGIPEIGVQVPMFRGAGDVQAPSPAPYAQQPSSGAAFQQKAGGRHHGRTKSGREIFHGPPGSYGMHGHGVISKDEFEQKWYERHPEDLKREKAGEYGPHIQENRKDYHWRADNLEKLVHTRGQDIGMGTSRDAVSTPDEQIGYMATEQFASRMASPRPQSSGRPASIKAGHTDSPLRNEAGQEVNEQGEVIHIDPPAHRSSKVHGGGYVPPTEDLGPEGGNTAEKGGWVTERGYGTPILASDEVKKHPDTEWRQPAVSPEMERHGNEYTVNEDGTPAYITKVRTHSRSSSQNNNPPQRIIPSPAQFDRGGTPLESHKEYEPLFPDDEEDSKRPKSQVDKLKRPSVARHQFPSQDVWEDTPGSLQLETTVETPEPQAAEEPESAGGAESVNPAKVFENPSTEEERKTHITKEDQQSFLPDHTRRFAAENKHLGKVRDENPLRPGMQQRFPSQDIWEDSPSYGHLETTVSTPQTEDTNEYAEESPVADKLNIPARPSIPARPTKKETASPIDKKAPIIPDRPKPHIPVRPSKPSTASSEKVPTVDPQTESDAPQAKAKPPVPARPASSKIAALQAGFLSDLNSKLGLGPQAPKVKEPEPEKEEEAAPLQDARKGRAKGPQRRKPAASPTPAATITAEVAVPTQKLSIGPVTAIWGFGEDGILDVPAARMAAKIHDALKAPAHVGTAQEAHITSQEVESSGDVVGDDAPAKAEVDDFVKTTTNRSEAATATEATIDQASSVTKQTSATLEPVVSNVSETLSRVATKTSDSAQEAVQPAATQVSETLEPIISKVSSALQLGEPLVAETASGSVDAPGAFPGSGPDLEDSK
ncbi:hypothetical protein T440DRAFT_516166 [Plenodomus tracheiphilus IPT5]|uniref:Altered inheritance of mitochondria protein 21 n=1 Tax=Plenodomus tracheiphilus IPT5 TaxID=1408161 RepID=A0A6A7BBX2_9PLEO|nr:hypothetical protein T440DRAFT_516166 [Plenodomus tracheiphilus IPT5]